jgi:cysteine desulfurase
MIYLDHNATTPMDPQVLDAMLPYFSEAYGNPSSVHRQGRVARAAVDQAREQVAALVGAHPSQVIFTSGGTEANNVALSGVAGMHGPAHLAVGSIEHASLLEPARALERNGWRLDLIPCDQQGRIDVGAAADLLHDDTRLLSVMWANNETGSVQDIPALAAAARERGVLFHTDAVQAAGKLPIHFADSQVHMMSLSAHKIYGPKGIGALVVDKSIELRPLLYGGGQEKGLRGGTENVPAIVGFGAAAELAAERLSADAAGQARLRDHLQTALACIDQVVLFATDARRLPNTLQFALRGIDGETLLMALDRKGMAVSSGSACASGSTEPSHVLRAMGVEHDLARGAVRVSLGRATTEEMIDEFLKALKDIIGSLGARVAWAS